MYPIIGGRKPFAPAAERNGPAILNALQDLLPPTGMVLEVASGTGQHVVHFAERLPGLTWQPTEADSNGVRSIEVWRADAGLPNILPPLLLDAIQQPWPLASADAVICINMIHIAPWAACVGLLSGAGRILPPGGPLILYGAYFIPGRETAPSNLEFDRMLRSHNPEWGVRSLDRVEAEARKYRLSLHRTIDMPGNNFIVAFRKDADGGAAA